MLRLTTKSAVKAAATALLLMVGWASSIGSPVHDDNAATQRLLACDAIADPDKRLACFTAAAESLKAHEIPRLDSPAAAAPHSDAPAAVQTTSLEPMDESPDPGDGLLEAMEAPSVSDSDNLYQGARAKADLYESVPFRATIVKVTQNHDGRYSVKLDNGEVWRETSGSRVREPKEGRVVEVYKGSTGGYRMKIEGIPSVAWVRRTK